MSSVGQISPSNSLVSKQYKGLEGAKVLGIVLYNQNRMIGEAYDQFLASKKNSEDAVAQGEKVDLFLKHSASPNELCTDGQHPLTKAIRQDRPWFFKKLVAHPHFNPDRKADRGFSPLEMAVLKENKVAISNLTAKGAKVDGQLLRWAANCGEPEIYHLVHAKFSESATERWFKYLDRWLQKAQSNFAQLQPWQQLEQSASNGLGMWRLQMYDTPEKRKQHLNNEFVKSIGDHNNLIPLFFKAGFDFNEPISEGNDRSPLLIAVDEKYGNDETIQTLLNLGADPDFTSQYQVTPLTAAASHGNSRRVKMLLGSGAKLGTNSENSWKTFHMPVHYGHAEVVQQLIDAGADIEHEDYRGWTPLHFAVHREHPEVVEVLLKAGAKNKKNSNGRTPLDMAQSDGIEAILAAFTRHNIRNEDN